MSLRTMGARVARATGRAGPAKAKQSTKVDLAATRRDTAMSLDNAERLRMAYENFNAQGSLPFDLMTDDVEFRQPDQLGGGEGAYHGREGVARGLRELFDVFDDVSCSAEGFTQADDCIVVFVRLCGRAKLSGVPIDASFAHVWRFRDEQADLWHAYTDRGEALKAVGLNE